VCVSVCVCVPSCLSIRHWPRLERRLLGAQQAGVKSRLTQPPQALPLPFNTPTPFSLHHHGPGVMGGWVGGFVEEGDVVAEWNG